MTQEQIDQLAQTIAKAVAQELVKQQERSAVEQYLVEQRRRAEEWPARELERLSQQHIDRNNDLVCGTNEMFRAWSKWRRVNMQRLCRELGSPPPGPGSKIANYWAHAQDLFLAEETDEYW